MHRGGSLYVASSIYHCTWRDGGASKSHQTNARREQLGGKYPRKLIPRPDELQSCMVVASHSHFLVGVVDSIGRLDYTPIKSPTLPYPTLPTHSQIYLYIHIHTHKHSQFHLQPRTTSTHTPKRYHSTHSDCISQPPQPAIGRAHPHPAAFTASPRLASHACMHAEQTMHARTHACRSRDSQSIYRSVGVCGAARPRLGLGFASPQV